MSVNLEVKCDKCNERIPRGEWARVRLAPATRRRYRAKAQVDLCESCLDELVLIPCGIAPAPTAPPDHLRGATKVVR